MKSFLKWTGGKGRLMAKLNDTFTQSGAECLVEPFVGSATVFLNTNFPKYILTDINPDLILLMHVAKDAPDGLIAVAEELFRKHNNENDYYEIRRNFNGAMRSPILRAAQFLYLNRHGFNGLCRYSGNGFNVPFGRYKQPYFPEAEIRAFAAKCRECDVSFDVADFADTIQRAPQGSLIYADPPYIPMSKTSAFCQYHKKGFGIGMQEKLSRELHTAAERGCCVVLTQSDTELTRSIFHGFDFKPVSVGRCINSKITSRGSVSELVGVLAHHNSVEVAA
ncbi:MAG: DNA adenine methylase [Plesiomonas sp.]